MAELTQREWSIAFEVQIGGQAALDVSTRFIEGWCKKEGGGGSPVAGSTNACAYNCLNTEQKWGKSTPCSSTSSHKCNDGSNTCGVQSFANVRDALVATAIVLDNSQYPHLFRALQTGDGKSLGMEQGSTMTSDIVTELGIWAGHRGDAAASTQYAKDVLKAASTVNDIGVWNQIVGGVADIGNAVASATGVAQATTFFTTINGLLADPTRIVKGLIGIVLLLVGLALLIKQLTPGIMKAVGA